MTANKVNPLEELTAQHAELQELLWQDLKQRLSGQIEPDHLQKLLSKLCSHSTETDLAAWEPESLSGANSSEAGDTLADEADEEPEFEPLSDANRQMLCESVREYPFGLTEDDIIATMLRHCREEYPDKELNLRDFLDA